MFIYCIPYYEQVKKFVVLLFTRSCSSFHTFAKLENGYKLNICLQFFEILNIS